MKIQHMVVVKFKPAATAAKIDELLASVSQLPARIEGIEYYAHGPYHSPEGLNQGFTHGFLIRFSSPQARDAYLVHPEHEAVKNAILPWVDAVIAFDFETSS